MIGVSKQTTTGWVIDDYGHAIEMRDPYVPTGKRQEGFFGGPSINEQIKTISEVVEIVKKNN